MNKYDALVICILVIFSFFFLFPKKEKGKVANVYYDTKLVLSIDLEGEKKEYAVQGKLGEVILVAGEGSIFVKQEESPKHLCSKQGKITSSHQKIVCLPNKIVIEIDDRKQFDTTVG